MAENIPSSVKLGVRPINFKIRAYSSGLRPCAATRSSVIVGSSFGALAVKSMHPENESILFRAAGGVEASFAYRLESKNRLTPLKRQRNGQKCCAIVTVYVADWSHEKRMNHPQLIF